MTHRYTALCIFVLIIVVLPFGVVGCVGFVDGLDDSFADDGFVDGFADGVDDGFADGVDDCFVDGVDDGFVDEGFADGVDVGFAERQLGNGVVEKAPLLPVNMLVELVKNVVFQHKV